MTTKGKASTGKTFLDDLLVAEGGLEDEETSRSEYRASDLSSAIRESFLGEAASSSSAVAAAASSSGAVAASGNSSVTVVLPSRTPNALKSTSSGVSRSLSEEVLPASQPNSDQDIAIDSDIISTTTIVDSSSTQTTNAAQASVPLISTDASRSLPTSVQYSNIPDAQVDYDGIATFEKVDSSITNDDQANFTTKKSEVAKDSKRSSILENLLIAEGALEDEPSSNWLSRIYPSMAPNEENP